MNLRANPRPPFSSSNDPFDGMSARQVVARVRELVPSGDFDLASGLVEAIEYLQRFILSREGCEAQLGHTESELRIFEEFLRLICRLEIERFAFTGKVPL